MKSKALAYLLFLCCLCVQSAAHAQAQPSSAHGWQMSPRGHIHMLIVLAEIDFDSSFAKLEPLDKAGHWAWPAHKMPTWKHELISREPEGDGYITKYFRQASFGQFQVTGDILDSLITVPISSIRDRGGKVVTQEAFASNYYKGAVVNAVNSIDSLRFVYGSPYAEFDRWTYDTPAGMPKKEQPNGRWDLVVIVFRNIHVNNLGNHSGYVNSGSIGSLKGKHSDMFSIFRTSDFRPDVILRHEFSHMLYGGNNFHTATGGAGTHTFMGTIGGWSNMSASGNCSQTWNAWDRERMNWRRPGAVAPYTLVHPESGEEAPGYVPAGSLPFGNGIFRLRDFATTGDAVKIQLPHLPGNVLPEFLWLENHQCLPGILDHDPAATPRGIYAYIQCGKDQREGEGVFNGDNNYLWPLHAAGQWDFRYEKDSQRVYVDSLRANPLTGYHYTMFHAFDLNGDGVIAQTGDMGSRSEYLLPRSTIINGVTPPDSFFAYQHYTVFGTDDQPFLPTVRNRISLGTNPSTANVYTHMSPGGPANHDVRRIYLNGLSITVLGQDGDGSMRIQIRWDDFEVRERTRWCGDILLTEKLILKPGGRIVVDQGYSPQLNKVVQTLNGEPVFAESTLLELAPGSEMRMENGSEVVLKSGSTLLVRAGATVKLEKKARFIAEPGAYLYVEQGATLLLPKRKYTFQHTGVMEVMPERLQKRYSDLKGPQTLPRSR